MEVKHELQRTNESKKCEIKEENKKHILTKLIFDVDRKNPRT